MERRVVITGIGMITPLGNSAKETWRNLIEGKSGIGPITYFDLNEYKIPAKFSRIAGKVKNFDLKEWGINKKTIKHMDPFSQYALAAAKEALSDAGINLAEENPFRIGVQIGSGMGGLETIEKQHRILLKKGPGRVSPFLIPMLIINMASGNISIILGTKGPNITNVTACASGSHAIGEAFDKIRLGRVDIMIAGGTEAALTPIGFSGFDKMGALSRRNDEPKKASRPFDRERDGFVMAEGAGMIILEELGRAKARDAKIYGELIGFGANSDAFHITEPSIEGPRECMRLAIREAEIKPEQVDYINAHGTSTPLGDVNEARAIKELFGEHADKLCISSTKSMIGHLLGAAGGVEAIVAILTIKEGIIPPTINLENPDPNCCGLDFVPNIAKEANIKVVLSNSFGFGGTNACLVFKAFE